MVGPAQDRQPKSGQ